MILMSSCGGGGGDGEEEGGGDAGPTEDPVFYTVSGMVSGLTHGGLVLQINGEDDLALNADGNFNFPSSLADGSSYVVSILSQSSDQVCTVTQQDTTLNGSDVNDVLVSCLPNAVQAGVSAGGVKMLRFSWDDTSANHYKLLKNPDGVSGYSQIGRDVNTTTINEEISVHLMNWADARYIVQACNALGDCSDSTPFAATSVMLDVIGFLKEPNIGKFNEFGNSIALSGDGKVLAVGSEKNSAVYLYEPRDAGWSLLAEIDRSSLSFGHRVSLSNDGRTLAVSAQRDASAATGINGDESDNSAPNSGAVYLFTRIDDGWLQQAYIKASNTESGDVFGTGISLSGDGDTLAVAALGEQSNATGINGDQTDNSTHSAGAVYLYVRSGGAWRQEAYIKASNTDVADHFGSSVKLSEDGTTLAVGAESASHSGIGSGAVYIFVKNGESWSQQAHINASNADPGDLFGCDVSLSADGNTLAVGARGEDSIYPLINAGEASNALYQAGAVYLFERSGTTWSQSVYIKSSNVDYADRFGWAVALSADGNILVASAPDEDSIATGINSDQSDNSALDSGALYLFKRNDSTWFQHAYIKASNTGEPYIEHDYGDLGIIKSNDEYGKTVALSADGRLLVVGASREASSSQTLLQDDDSVPGAGAVYLY
ncbi:MAG: hypothetical protein AB2551_03800 [Candidatus Thiodiazotropha sp.]